VLWPQQQLTPIYHNRASWPFVTAYWLRAARQVRNDASVDWNVAAMVRAAALNLSNMENLEFVTGRARVEDGMYSGPVVNSQRQLWSVAGYLSMVHDVVFGLETSARGIRARPFITRAMRSTWFGRADRIALQGYTFRGRRLDVRVTLPPPGEDRAGAYAVGSVRLNGRDVGEDFIDPATLPERSVIEVELRDTPEARAALNTTVDVTDWRQVFGPRTPSVALTAAGGRVQVRVDTSGEERSTVDVVVLRDGQRVATLGPTDGDTWTDPAADEQTVSRCYSVELGVSRLAATLRSTRAAVLVGRMAPSRVQQFDATRLTATGGRLADGHGRMHYEDWGDPGHRLEVPSLRVAQGGRLPPAGDRGPTARARTTTGITCGVKRVRVIEVAGGAHRGRGLRGHAPARGLGPVARLDLRARASLAADRDYRVVIGDDDRRREHVGLRALHPVHRGPGGRWRRLLPREHRGVEGALPRCGRPRERDAASGRLLRARPRAR
jgi:hypothetical protein